MYQSQLYRWRCTTYWCHEYFVACLNARNLCHSIRSVDCDATGRLWRHQKAVSYIGWDKSFSDPRCLSRTPTCTRQNDSRQGSSHSSQASNTIKVLWILTQNTATPMCRCCRSVLIQIIRKWCVFTRALKATQRTVICGEKWCMPSPKTPVPSI